MSTNESRPRHKGGSVTNDISIIDESGQYPVHGPGASYGSSTVRRSRRTNAELDALDETIIAIVTAEAPISLRGVYYRCVAAGAVDKTEVAYRAVGRELLKLRRSGRVPYRSITDGTRWITKPTTWGSIDAMLANAAISYRRALWHDQDADVHVYTEKDAISGVILPVTQTWDVPLGVLRGFCGESFAASVGDEIRASGRTTFVYQLGDHDPSGVSAWEDFQRKVHRFAGSTPVHFERLAVTPDQITEFSLPTRPTKSTDTRSAKFHGESVEVDAMPTAVLRRLVEDAITRHIDSGALELTRLVEDQERAGLEALARGCSA